MVFNLFGNKKTNKHNPHEHYYNLLVKDVVRETDDAITIVFEQPEDKIEYQSGQFLTLIITVNGKKYRRAYSFCSSPVIDDDLAVMVKKVDGGIVSNYLNDHLKPGERIEVMEPMGSFTTEYHPDNKRHMIMFAGGSGITPFMSHIKTLLHEEKESMASLIYCNRKLDSVIYKSELDDIQTNYEGRFHVIHVLDEAPMNWQGHSGLLNHDMLEKILERIPTWDKESTNYLMCGPEGMMNNVQSLLAEQGIKKDEIKKESFVAGTIGKDEKKTKREETIQTRKVKVHFEGEEHIVEVTPETTILEAALDEGIDLPYSCQSGLCTACRSRLLSGKIKMDEDEGLSDAEKEEGYVLICVGHPLTDDVKIEGGQ